MHINRLSMQPKAFRQTGMIVTNRKFTSYFSILEQFVTQLTRERRVDIAWEEKKV